MDQLCIEFEREVSQMTQAGSPQVAIACMEVVKAVMSESSANFLCRFIPLHSFTQSIYQFVRPESDR